MAIAYIRTRQGGANVDIPVVNIGSSPLPSKVRVQTPAGLGELPLVHLDDVRASKLRVRQDGVTYAVAKDGRTQIVHTGPWSIVVAKDTLGEKSEDEDTRVRSLKLGTTEFNRVTRVEMTLTHLKGGWICEDVPLVTFSGWDDFCRADGWMELRQGNAVKYTSSVHSTPTVQLTHPGGRVHHALKAEWNGSVVFAVDTTPGVYDVYVVWRVWVKHQFHIDGGRFRPVRYDYYHNQYVDDDWEVCIVSQWTEIARG